MLSDSDTNKLVKFAKERRGITPLGRYRILPRWMVGRHNIQLSNNFLSIFPCESVEFPNILSNWYVCTRQFSASLLTSIITWYVIIHFNEEFLSHFRIFLYQPSNMKVCQSVGSRYFSGNHFLLLLESVQFYMIDFLFSVIFGSLASDNKCHRRCLL